MTLIITQKEVAQIFHSVFNIENNIPYSFSHKLIGDKNFDANNILGEKGNPQTKNTGSNIVIKTAIIILSIAVLLYLFSQNSSDNNTQQLTSTQVMYEVKNFLKKEYLVDPDSYQSIKWSDLHQLNDEESDNIVSYKVMHKFRAKNSFGGYAVEELIFHLNYKGKVLRIE